MWAFQIFPTLTGAKYVLVIYLWVRCGKEKSIPGTLGGSFEKGKNLSVHYGDIKLKQWCVSTLNRLVNTLLAKAFILSRIKTENNQIWGKALKLSNTCLQEDDKSNRASRKKKGHSKWAGNAMQPKVSGTFKWLKSFTFTLFPFQMRMRQQC